MKLIFPMLEENGQKMVKSICSTTVNEISVLEAKKLCSKFTLENVNACAFGMDSQCFRKTEPMDMRMAYGLVKTGSWGVYKYFLSTIIPRIHKVLNIRIVNSTYGNELLHMIHAFMSYRVKSGVVRNDFLDSMVQLKENAPSNGFDILALGANFFVDGYETSSTVMALLLFELAMHKEVQNKLRSEIRQSKELSGGKLSCEVVQSMRYLDACFNENLRVHSIVSTLGKTCTKSYTYHLKHRNTSVVIEKGTPIIIPISAIHHDPQYFENPIHFCPERFLEKKTLQKYTFMPFGEGPRSCLGKRFGVLQIKVGVIDIISNFELSVNEKTELPLKYNPWFFVVAPTKGIWINAKKILE
ncbi:unnamed protein product [Acanthoscelides obtectus]|nr:unnamed protein product [Acanthoscelides obtectus]CAK1649481.1 Probable cytochrome P450 6a13 [Acanthoscelides obtectus]